MLLFRLIFSLLALSLFTACGFQPLYGERTQNAQVSGKLAATYILPIDGRDGQIVRNELMDLITPKGIPAAIAKVLFNAVKKANALEFIDHFPEGFETLVGE